MFADPKESESDQVRDQRQRERADINNRMKGKKKEGTHLQQVEQSLSKSVRN